MALRKKDWKKKFVILCSWKSLIFILLGFSQVVNITSLKNSTEQFLGFDIKISAYKTFEKKNTQIGSCLVGFGGQRESQTTSQFMTETGE